MPQQDDTKIENLYQNFKKNHNDMKSNRYLYDIKSNSREVNNIKVEIIAKILFIVFLLT